MQSIERIDMPGKHCEYDVVEASFHFWNWFEINMGNTYINKIWPEPIWRTKIEKKGVIREEHHFVNKYVKCNSPFHFWTGLDTQNRIKVHRYYVNEMKGELDDGSD